MSEPLSRETALDAIDRIREALTPGGTAHNALAGVVRDLWDGYPIDDARSSLDVASYLLPYETTQAVRDVLNRTVET